MKYVNGTFLKTCNERLREKLMIDPFTHREYMAYYPKGWEIIDYFDHGSQVNVSIIRPRDSNHAAWVENKPYLLKNERPDALNLRGREHYADLQRLYERENASPSARSATKRSMQASHLVEKCFKPKYAPKIPKVIEGAYISDNPLRNYLIEEFVPGERLTLDLFNSFSNKKQKHVLNELAKSLCKMHFLIPDRYLRLSGFCIDPNISQYPNPLPQYKRSMEIGSFFESEKLALIHYDLEPKNILYNDETVTIIDYGRATISSRKTDFRRVKENYSNEFAARLMDAYLLVCGRFTKRWGN